MNGETKQYRIRCRGRIVTIDLDTRLKPDDEWRSVFYDLYTLRDMAKHIVHNILRFGRGSFVEGVGTEGPYDPKGQTGGFKIVSIEET